MGVIKSKTLNIKGCGKYSTNVEFYESAFDVVKDCKSRKITSSSFYDYDNGYEIDESFTGVKTYDEALDLLKNGYQPTVQGLGRALRTNNRAIEKRIKFENNIYGFSPVVPLALKGIPNSMINSQMKPIKCKVIDVYYDMTVCAGTSTKTIIENGEKILSAIIDLEKQGYRFNLYAVQCYADSNSADCLCVKVKSSNKPLDLKRISFPLTHPAFFRVIGFDWYGKCPVAKYRSGYGHSPSRDFSDNQMKEFVKQTFGENACYVNCAYAGDVSKTNLEEVFKNADTKAGEY